MSGMTKKTLGKVSVWVAALLIATASEFFPVVGFFAAALVFPQGIHSDHATAYLVLAMILNFAIFFAATFSLLRLFVHRMT
jgi:hypothetical protein